jgi:hypothetical protein
MDTMKFDPATLVSVSRFEKSAGSGSFAALRSACE